MHEWKKSSERFEGLKKSLHVGKTFELSNILLHHYLYLSQLFLSFQQKSIGPKTFCP